MIKKYNSFLELKPLNENLAKSKKFLKEVAILKTTANKLGYIDDDLEYKMKEGEIKTLTLKHFTPEQQKELRYNMRSVKLSDNQIREIEQNKEFVKLRELLSQNLGYLYPFVYMYFVEKIPFNEIESMYNDVIEYKSTLDQFKTMEEVGKKFDVNFIDPNIPNDKETRTNAEILADGLERLKDLRKVKKILDTLPSSLKKEYKKASVLDKQGMVEIAVAFDEIPDGDKETGEKDHSGNPITKKERIWKNFFGELKKDTDEFLPNGQANPKYGKLVYKSRLRRFESMSNPIRELVRAAKAHLDASLSGDGYSERLEKIERCNDKFGVMGAEIVLHENGVMIVQVNSHAANSFLNSHCNHCIVNYSSYWDSYLGDYNKQYYIYNFNLSSMEDLSTIGVTIKPDRTWPSGGCQSMRNNGIPSFGMGQFKNILKGWEEEYGIETDLFNALEPMSDEEIEKRKRAKVAEREIVRKGITIEQIKQYVKEDGADINKDNAKALVNSVEEDDYEKTKLCLSLGASPNLAKGNESPISKAKNIDMIKLLVKYGSDMTGSVFNNILHDIEALDYCLKAGLDPNFSNSMPLRKVIKGSWESKENIGDSYFEAFKLLLKYGAKLVNDAGRIMVVKYASEFKRIDIIQYLIDEGYAKDFDDSVWIESIKWLKHARKTSEEDKQEIIEFLKNQLSGEYEEK